jgi:hypothetical protein
MTCCDREEFCNILSQFAACTIVYLSFNSSVKRPMSLKARSGAVLTVTSLNGPLGVGLAIVKIVSTSF